MSTYHFGVPGTLVWITHILFGLYFVNIGYKTLNKKPLKQIDALVLIITGVVMSLYHAHIWLLDR